MEIPQEGCFRRRPANNAGPGKERRAVREIKKKIAGFLGGTTSPKEAVGEVGGGG